MINDQRSRSSLLLRRKLRWQHNAIQYRWVFWFSQLAQDVTQPHESFWCFQVPSDVFGCVVSMFWCSQWFDSPQQLHSPLLIEPHHLFYMERITAFSISFLSIRCEVVSVRISSLSRGDLTDAGWFIFGIHHHGRCQRVVGVVWGGAGAGAGGGFNVRNSFLLVSRK